ncbi:MAG: hypothetical protein ABI640_04440 [Gammaproteobacteria bacterium]
MSRSKKSDMRPEYDLTKLKGGVRGKYVPAPIPSAGNKTIGQPLKSRA